MYKSLLHLLIGFAIHLAYIGQSQACFVVHYVLYFDNIPMKYYLQMSQNSSFPYMVHLNQELNLPNNRTFTRVIQPAQMSDIKKVQVIYHHGGLYLDNDQFINYNCVRQRICNLTGLYFLDWTEKQRWRVSVPLSFIYSSHAFNDTLRQSLQGLDQSIQANDKGPRTVFFSGPSHMQQYRSGMQFVKIPKSCEFHRADRSWIAGKPQNQLRYEKSVESKVLKSYTTEQKLSKQKFVELWLTYTVIYPPGFDMSMQAVVDEEYNHVEMVDKVYCRIRVMQYSKLPENRKRLQQFMQKYEGSLNVVKQQTTQQLLIQQNRQNSEKTIEKSIIAAQKTQIKQKNNKEKAYEIITAQQKQQQINLYANFIITLFSQLTYQKLALLTLLLISCGVICYRKTRCCHSNNYQKQKHQPTIQNKKSQVYQTQHQLQQQQQQQQQQQPNSAKIFETTSSAILPDSRQGYKQDTQEQQYKQLDNQLQEGGQDQNEKVDVDIQYQLCKSTQPASGKNIDP